jgi:hypothetical protein
MASPYQHQDDFYDRPSASQATVVAPPPLPHHLETGRDSTDQYAMKDISVNSPSPYPVYNNHNGGSHPSTPTPLPQHRFSDQHRDSLSDMKFIDHYDSDDDLEKIIPREKKKRSCMDKLCCGCCTCCPKWLRWCSCIFLIIILILVIVVGVLAALFKVPKVDFSGLEQEPVVTNANNILHMDFSVGISVDNPNFESITFETIVADVSSNYCYAFNTFIHYCSIGILSCSLQRIYWWWKCYKSSYCFKCSY